MRIAIFHNYLDNIGGAEIVTLTLARALSADVYTTNISQENIAKMGFADVSKRIYSLGRIPKSAPFRQQIALWKFRRLNLSGRYDFFIIAGDWAMSGAVNNHPNLWYAHSPLNELWEFTGFIKQELLNFWKKPLYDIWVLVNRRLSLKYARSVDNWVANSNNTKLRIEKYYQQTAKVIYPPVACSAYQAAASQVPVSQAVKTAGDYWLSVNRLAAHKRPEIQLEAFKDLPEERLIMVASYEEGVAQFEACKARIDNYNLANVEIRHWVSDTELKELYAHCRGFITTAQNEDFGLTAVEAMAAGKPVIAPAEGGYLESVLSGRTGALIKDIGGASLRQAILQVSTNLKNNPNYYQAACYEQAARFDTAVFIKAIKEIIDQPHGK